MPAASVCIRLCARPLQQQQQQQSYSCWSAIFPFNAVSKLRFVVRVHGCSSQGRRPTSKLHVPGSMHVRVRSTGSWLLRLTWPGKHDVININRLFIHSAAVFYLARAHLCKLACWCASTRCCSTNRQRCFFCGCVLSLHSRLEKTGLFCSV